MLATGAAQNGSAPSAAATDQQVSCNPQAPRRAAETATPAAGFHANHIAGSPADRAPVPQQGILDVSSLTSAASARVGAAIFSGNQQRG